MSIYEDGLDNKMQDLAKRYSKSIPTNIEKNKALDELLRSLFENGANAYYRHSDVGELGKFQDKKNTDVAEATQAINELIISARRDELDNLLFGEFNIERVYSRLAELNGQLKNNRREIE